MHEQRDDRGRDRDKDIGRDRHRSRGRETQKHGDVNREGAVPTREPTH